MGHLQTSVCDCYRESTRTRVSGPGGVPDVTFPRHVRHGAHTRKRKAPGRQPGKLSCEVVIKSLTNFDNFYDSYLFGIQVDMVPKNIFMGRPVFIASEKTLIFVKL